MKRSIVILTTVLALFIVSCKQNTNSEVQILNFSGKQNVNPADILELDFIKLETNDNCLIDKSIMQIELVSGKLFVLTGGCKQVFVFDMSGKFIAQIGSVGSGPGEYILASSFSIDSKRNIISIVDWSQKKVNNYSLDNYAFISSQNTISIEQSELETFSGFEYLDNDKIVWKSSGSAYSGKWSFVVTDLEYKYINKYIENDVLLAYHTASLKGIYKCGNELIAYTDYNPFVYEFRNDSIYPRYKLEFGEHKLPPPTWLEQMSAENINFFGKLTESGYVRSFRVFENEDILVVSYRISEVYYVGIYDKRNNKTFNYTMEDFQKSLKIGKIEDIAGVVNDYIAAVIFPFDILENMEKYPLTPKLQSLAAELKDDDNPVLCLFKLKK